MFQTCVLTSGSKGNSILIRTDKTKILLDAGLSGKKLIEFLGINQLSGTKLNGVIISHEHSDHISGAGVVARKFGIPLYISQSTFMVSRHKIGKLPVEPIFFETGSPFFIDDLKVEPFPSSHDVVDGSNFIFTQEGNSLNKLAIATDLGYTSRLMLHKFSQATTIILESNHDEKMLIEGPYPWNLKQRIKSREGHLSNSQAVGAISKIIHPQLKNLILAHLSEKNNKPELAYNLMREYLKMVNYELNLIVSNQYEPTPLMDV